MYYSNYKTKSDELLKRIQKYADDNNLEFTPWIWEDALDREMGTPFSLEPTKDLEEAIDALCGSYGSKAGGAAEIHMVDVDGVSVCLYFEDRNDEGWVLPNIKPIGIITSSKEDFEII